MALATACALVGIECEIHMGQVDIEKEHPNVTKMKILGCKLVPVTRGTQTLKDAVDSAFEEYLKDPVNLPVRDRFCGRAASLSQNGSGFSEHRGTRSTRAIPGETGKITRYRHRLCGWRFQCIGLFTAFLNDEEVKLVGVEPAGKGLDTNDHAATLTLGTKGAIHGFECYNLQDDEGNPLPVYSIASGWIIPVWGLNTATLKTSIGLSMTTADDKECLKAFMTLSRLEGIIPALESAHAIAYAMRVARDMSSDQTILINLSGRGDKDADFVADKLDL